MTAPARPSSPTRRSRSMAIDGEPKNGDFARYIEELSRTGGAPGQVLPAQRAPAAAAQSGVAGKLSELTWGKRSERTAPAPLPASGAEQAAPAPTLAASASARRMALFLTIGALIAGWNALSFFMAALTSGRLDIDTMMPALFLAIAAWMLFKGARNLRAGRRGQLPKLPPLNTLPKGPNHRG
ncbi:hypothetical protein CS343_15435 [Bordetella bronchiseptica]|nr:hypothetical protein [Bordetella bronchiseptica]AZW31555.1 hypothetical protein CS343_15435 [Bordetella bronchiseptica]